jgi:hypothetical protein
MSQAPRARSFCVAGPSTRRNFFSSRASATRITCAPPASPSGAR